MTLPELFAEFDADAMRQRRTFEVATLTAWQTANLMRTAPSKRLPTLKKLLEQFGKSKPQTPREASSALRALAATYGGKVRKVKPNG